MRRISRIRRMLAEQDKVAALQDLMVLVLGGAEGVGVRDLIRRIAIMRRELDLVPYHVFICWEC